MSGLERTRGSFISWRYARMPRVADDRLPIEVAVTTGAIDCGLLAEVAQLKPQRSFRKPSSVGDLAPP